MGAQPSSASSASKIATDAFDELDAKPINHAQLAGLLRSENADLLAVTSRYAGVRCSLLVRAMQRQDARAVQVIIDAAARRGSAYLSRVLNQSFAPDRDDLPLSVYLRAAWPWLHDSRARASRDCLRALFRREELELWPQQDGKGYSVFVAQLSSREEAGGVENLKALLKTAAERFQGGDKGMEQKGDGKQQSAGDAKGQQGQQQSRSDAAVVRALSLADSNGITPMIAAAAGGQRAAVEHLIELGVSPRLHFTECDRRGGNNPSRFAPLAFCLHSHFGSLVQRPLFRHTPLDERQSALDPTLFMISGRTSAEFVRLAQWLHREHQGGASAGFKDPFRKPLPPVEETKEAKQAKRGEAGDDEPKEPELLSESQFDARIKSRAVAAAAAAGASAAAAGATSAAAAGAAAASSQWWRPPFDLFATCSLFHVLAPEGEGDEDGAGYAQPDHRMRFHPPQLLNSFEWLTRRDYFVAQSQSPVRPHRQEWDAGFTVLHCPDLHGNVPALEALRLVSQLYSEDTLRRFVRVRSARHRFTALHMACALGHRDLILRLLETGHCDVNAQTDLGATPLHLLLASNSKPQPPPYPQDPADGRPSFGSLLNVLSALLAAGARDDLVTVDGDCAARLLTELIESKDRSGGWAADGGSHARRALIDCLDRASLGGDEGDAAGETLTELGVLSAPVVALVLGYIGRAHIHYQRFLGRSAFARDAKAQPPLLSAPLRPHFNICL